MQKDKIIEALETALDEKSELFVHALDKAAKRPPEFAEALLHHDLSQPVKDVLKTQDEFSGDRTLYVRQPNGYGIFDSDRISPKLVAIAREKKDAAQALDWLEKVLATEKAEGIWVMALWGVSVDNQVSLLPEVDLIPIDELPESDEKEWLQRPRDTFPNWHSLMSPLRLGQPKSALIQHTVVEPFLVHLEGNEGLGEFKHEGNQLLDDVMLTLTAVGPSVTIPALYWFQYKDPDLDFARLGHIISHHHLEVTPMHLSEYGSFDFETAESAVKSFFQLEDKTRRKVRIALERLNLAMRRRRPADQALELCIALETLLTQGPGENTYKIGLRSARLLGGDLEEQLKNRVIVSGTYILRSALVHDGEDKETIKLKNQGKVRAKSVVNDAIPICAAVIRRILELGSIPDWYEFELAG